MPWDSRRQGAARAGFWEDATGARSSARRNREPGRSRAKRAESAFAEVPAKPAVEAVLEGADARLFSSLKALRGSIAREEQVPPYVVFTDRTLAEFAVRKPRSAAGLLQVHGVGRAKLDKYGERFLAAIKSADETEAA